jgi:hypothetical protein
MRVVTLVRNLVHIALFTVVVHSTETLRSMEPGTCNYHGRIKHRKIIGQGPAHPADLLPLASCILRAQAGIKES